MVNLSTVSTANGIEIAMLKDGETVITDVQSALDLMATVRYETGCDRLVIHGAMLDGRFFDLKTGMAGEILQKFVNYQTIVGDFSKYESKSLRDFMYECNQGKQIIFVPDEEQALEKLGAV